MKGDLLSANRNHPDRRSFPQQRHDKECSRANNLVGGRSLRELIELCGKIINMEGLPVDNGATPN